MEILKEILKCLTKRNEGLMEFVPFEWKIPMVKFILIANHDIPLHLWRKSCLLYSGKFLVFN